MLLDIGYCGNSIIMLHYCVLCITYIQANNYVLPVDGYEGYLSGVPSEHRRHWTEYILRETV